MFEWENIQKAPPGEIFEKQLLYISLDIKGLKSGTQSWRWLEGTLSVFLTLPLFYSSLLFLIIQYAFDIFYCVYL